MRLAVIEVCREAAGADAAHLVTRETGRVVRDQIVARLEALPPGGVLTLDFTGIGIVDYSCADECLAKLVQRVAAGEYGEKYLQLTGLGPSQRENVEVALERRKLAALVAGRDGSWECLGTLTSYLRETLRLVMAREGLSARELAGLLDLELTASSTRLINLHRLRLVCRRERPIGEGGREFVYEGLPRQPAAAPRRVAHG